MSDFAVENGITAGQFPNFDHRYTTPGERPGISPVTTKRCAHHHVHRLLISSVQLKKSLAH
jgi:hypothetical protein